MSVINVGVLGESGITGQAVISVLKRLDGYTYTPTLDTADIVVCSPGISPKDYPDLSVPFISEIEFAYRLFHRSKSTYCPKLIGVTGTNGKSTVVSCISHITQIPFSGNIGVPLIEFVDRNPGSDWLVVELSSYQLEGCLQFRPDIAVFLNLTPDHFQRHHTMAQYGAVKQRLFSAQKPDDILLFDLKDERVVALCSKSTAKSHFFSSDYLEMIPNSVQSYLLGPHTQFNVGMALQVAVLAGFDSDTCIDQLSSFSILEHRLEQIGVYDGCRVFNDSKSTNPDSTFAAIKAFDCPIHLIICGADKGLPVDTFINGLRGRLLSLIVFGGVSDLVSSAAQDCDIGCPVYKVESLDDAVIKGFDLIRHEDVLLFSPGYPSFDRYKNFEDRGQLFKQTVFRYVETKGLTSV